MKNFGDEELASDKGAQLEVVWLEEAKQRDGARNRLDLAPQGSTGRPQRGEFPSPGLPPRP